MNTVVRGASHLADGEQLSLLTVTPRDEREGARGVVLLHGAGNGDKERVLPLAEDFAAHGHPALALDFSGHGASTGGLRDLSPRRRRDQAAAVIDEVFHAERPLILVGLSMSGQTVADLLERYGSRVTALVPCAPGIYGAAVQDVPFGDGFTELIRRPESRRDSPALAAYARFGGRALLVVPERDAVIPDGVTELLHSALATRADLSVLRLTGDGHQLGLWPAGHAQDREDIVDAVFRPRPATPPGRTANPAAVAAAPASGT